MFDSFVSEGEDLEEELRNEMNLQNQIVSDMNLENEMIRSELLSL